MPWSWNSSWDSMKNNGMRYEGAFAKAHPFDKLVEGMLQPQMVHEAADFMRQAEEDGIETSIIINNRADGNAPAIAQNVAEEVLTQPKYQP